MQDAAYRFKYVEYLSEPDIAYERDEYCGDHDQAGVPALGDIGFVVEDY